MAQILDEPSVFLMWPRAALMQLANEDISPTEVTSGAYAARGARRWSSTIGYLRIVLTGDDATIGEVVRAVNRVHADVGVPDEQKQNKRRPVFDPKYQLWVSATWFVSIIDTYELLVSPIDSDVLDGLYREFWAIGNVLQMSDSVWPDDVSAFYRYVQFVETGYPESMPRSLPDDDPEYVTPGDIAAQVFASYSLPRRYLRFSPLIKVLTWGMAGERLRRVYDVPWTEHEQARFVRAVRRIRMLHRVYPARLRRRRSRRHRETIAHSLVHEQGWQPQKRQTQRTTPGRN